MSESKMRDALITAREVLRLEGYPDNNVAMVKIHSALQPVAVVELTDAEIYESYADGAGLFNRRIPFTEQEIRGLRAVIAAHEAKQSGGEG